MRSNSPITREDLTDPIALKSKTHILYYMAGRLSEALVKLREGENQEAAKDAAWYTQRIREMMGWEDRADGK